MQNKPIAGQGVWKRTTIWSGPRCTVFGDKDSVPIDLTELSKTEWAAVKKAIGILNAKAGYEGSVPKDVETEMQAELDAKIAEAEERTLEEIV